jgi:DNA-binding MarR family transcriptional regulator
MGSEKGFSQYEFNKMIHEPARLLILAFLASSQEKERSFTELRDHLQMTAGNLSIQLKNLQEAGFINVQKSFEDGKPLTTVAISASGSDTLIDYLETMEKLIVSVKQEQPKKIQPQKPTGEE